MLNNEADDNHQCGALNILELPAPLQVDLFTKWVDLKDIGKLDSALCSTVLREPYFNAWRQEHAIFLSDFKGPFHLSESLAAWLKDRRLNMGCDISFADPIALSEDLDGYFRSVQSTLKSLIYSELMAKILRPEKLPGTVEGFVKKASLCKELSSLQLVQVPLEEGDLRKVLTKCAKLKKLGFLLPNKIDFQAIHECGTALEELEITMLRPSSSGGDGGFCGREDAEDAEDAYPYVQYEKTHTLRKITVKDGENREEWDFLLWFMVANAGLQHVFIDCLTWFDVRYLIESCQKLVTLRAYAKLPERGRFGWGVFEDTDDGLPLKGLNDEEDLPLLIDKAKSIRYLHLAYNRRPLLTEEQFLRLVKQCPQHVVLSLADMYDEEDLWLESERALPVPIRTAFPASATRGLQALHVRKISLYALGEVFGMCPHLAEVAIQEFEADALAATLALLVKKNVSRVQLSLKTVPCAALAALTGLEFLHLFGCAQLTSADLLAIALNNPGLTHLRVRDCKKVTAQFLGDILRACPKLERLHMDTGNEELEDLCAQLKRENRALKHVHLRILAHKE